MKTARFLGARWRSRSLASACGDDEKSSGGAGARSRSATGEKAAEPRRLGRAMPKTAAPYPTYDWVHPFQDQTGCIVKSKIAATSDEMFQLMSTGQYDGVSASGDSSVRLIDAGLVAPVNTDADQELRGPVAVPQGHRSTTRATARTTASRTVGAPTT